MLKCCAPCSHSHQWCLLQETPAGLHLSRYDPVLEIPGLLSMEQWRKSDRLWTLRRGDAQLLAAEQALLHKFQNHFTG